MKYFYLIGFILTTFGAIIHLRDVRTEYNVSQNGIIVQGRVAEVPSICGRRNNRIEVDYDAKRYSLIISRNQCIGNEFKKSDVISILYSKEDNLAILPSRNVLISYYIAIGFFIIPLLLLLFLLKPKPKT